MKIEDCWEDRIAYHISFLTLDERKISLMIFLPSEINEEQAINEIIMKNFKGIKKILKVDEWGIGLLLKDRNMQAKL